MTLLPLLIPFAVLTLCAFHDVTSFKIPNRYVAVLLGAWPVVAFLTGMPLDAAGMAALIAGIALAAGFALFAFNLLGAGDVKLISATCLWVGPAAMMPFLLYTTVIGAILGVFLLKLRAQPLPASGYKFGWLVELHERERAMPYGVAIAGGAMIAMAQTMAQTLAAQA